MHELLLRVRYVFPLARPLRLEDHWQVPLLGGQCRLVENEGLVTAIEYSKAGLSTDLAFVVEQTPHLRSKFTITGQDDLLPVVRDHIRRGFSFLQCFFNADISVGEVEVHHEAESPDEADQIPIRSFHYGRKQEEPLVLPFDLLSRSLMAATDHDGPEFLSTLVTNAREAASEQRYIDAFRFAFLLIESLFGGGKFKAKQLTAEFSSSSQLTQAINQVIAEWKTRPVKTPSATLTLMDSGPSVEEVIKHLVEMRGHYFHGNLAKKGAWHPAKQEEADALAWLAIGITQKIAADAASPIFTDEYVTRHFRDAETVGALVVMKITYRYRIPEDDFIRTHRVNLRAPGTKPTTAMAMEAAFRSLQIFKDRLSVGRLHSVTANDTATGAEIFSIRFPTEPDGKFVDD